VGRTRARKADDDEISPGGSFTPGSDVVLGRDLRERFRQQIEVDLPSGWFPADAERGLGLPEIVSPVEVVLRVPAEGERRFAIRSTNSRLTPCLDP
jgi:hypothetical protein